MRQELDRSFTSLEGLRRGLRAHGAERGFVKLLGVNNNSKNQIYLGTDFGILEQLPGRITFRNASTSQTKSRSRPGASIPLLELPLYWLWPDGQLFRAPNATVPFYSQYPEARLSGFLEGCARAPACLKVELDERYGRRVLILAPRESDVLAVVVTDADSPGLVDELLSMPAASGLGRRQGKSPLRLLAVDPFGRPDFDRLVEELRGLAGSWHRARVLRRVDAPPDFVRHNQGSGWTLEALLGIPRNAVAGPDKYGFEIKALHPSRVSVTTTEPTFGYRKERGMTKFLSDFGWPGRKGDGSWRYNGSHHVGRVVERGKGPKTVLLEHWDHARQVPDRSGQEPEIKIVDLASETVLAGWKYTDVADKWSRKHSGCAYVTFSRRPQAGLAEEYLYGPTAYFGLGTSVNKLFSALSDGIVYFEPGDALYEDGRTKRRMQWRVEGTAGSPLVDQLARLYGEWRVVELVGSSSDP